MHTSLLSDLQLMQFRAVLEDLHTRGSAMKRSVIILEDRQSADRLEREERDRLAYSSSGIYRSEMPPDRDVYNRGYRACHDSTKSHGLNSFFDADADVAPPANVTSSESSSDRRVELRHYCRVGLQLYSNSQNTLPNFAIMAGKHSGILRSCCGGHDSEASPPFMSALSPFNSCHTPPCTESKADHGRRK